MKVWLLFHPETWKLPIARHCMETLGSLLETPQRLAVLGSDIPAGEPTVYVGPTDQAPAGAAAVVPVDGWPAWSMAELEVARFDGEPLLCPRADLGPPVSERALPGPWLRSVGFLIGREEELIDSRRDQWGCFSGFYARAGAKGVLDVPLVNLHALQLARRIEAWCEQRHLSLERIPRWKDGARFAVVLSHDVDDVTLYSLRGAWRLLQQAGSPTSYASRAGLAHMLHTLARGPRRHDPYWNFDRWAAEEERRGFRSTFFFCPSDPRRRHEFDPIYRMTDRLRFEGRGMTVATMLGELARRDFEIGLHGSYMSYHDGRELIRQKGQIEAAAGRPVRGLRQHFLRFDVRSTWSAQEHAEFLYDTTLGYNEAIGFRAGIAAPFHPWDSMVEKSYRILELPLTVMDGALFRTLKLDGAGAAERVREHLVGVERAGGLGVLLWHPNVAFEERFPGWWESYVRTLDHLASRGAWVTTAGSLADWWIGREARIRPKV